VHEQRAHINATPHPSAGHLHRAFVVWISSLLGEKGEKTHTFPQHLQKCAVIRRCWGVALKSLSTWTVLASSPWSSTSPTSTWASSTIPASLYDRMLGQPSYGFCDLDANRHSSPRKERMSHPRSQTKKKPKKTHKKNKLYRMRAKWVIRAASVSKKNLTVPTVSIPLNNSVTGVPPLTPSQKPKMTAKEKKEKKSQQQALVTQHRDPSHREEKLRHWGIDDPTAPKESQTPDSIPGGITPTRVHSPSLQKPRGLEWSDVSLWEGEENIVMDTRMPHLNPTSLLIRDWENSRTKA